MNFVLSICVILVYVVHLPISRVSVITTCEWTLQGVALIIKYFTGLSFGLLEGLYKTEVIIRCRIILNPLLTTPSTLILCIL